MPDGPGSPVRRARRCSRSSRRAGLPIEPGCRLGVCGADPIAVLEGTEKLAPIGDDELSTLERLGLADATRLACWARVPGAVHGGADAGAARPARTRRARRLHPPPRSAVV